MDYGTRKVQRSQNPYETATIVSKFTYWWLKELFKKGFKTIIREDDIYENLQSHDSCILSKKFETLWELEKINSNNKNTRRKPSLLRVILNIYGLKIFGLTFLFSLVSLISRIYQPLCLGGLVTYFVSGQTQTTKTEAYMYAAGIILFCLLPVLVSHPILLYIVQIGMKIRIACCSMVYKKTLRISKSVDGLTGRVINLLSNDAAKFDTAICFIQNLYLGPVELLVLGYFIYCEIGVAGLIGIGFMLCIVPLQIWMGRVSGTYRMQTAIKTDKRIRLMNEILQGIQVIKMYAWEKAFVKIIDTVRYEELQQIKGTLFIRGALVVFTIVSRLAIFLSLIAYIYFGNVFTARKVFTITSYFNMLYTSMLHLWPVALISISEILVSIKRIQTFLLYPEHKPKNAINYNCTEEQVSKSVELDFDDVINTKSFNSKISLNNGSLYNITDKLDNLKMKLNVEDEENPMLLKNSKNINLIRKFSTLKRQQNPNATNKEIIFKDATAYYAQNGSELIVGIKSINLRINERSLCAVIGPVGSGKSTLLEVILGELELDDGSVVINGTISYGSQEPWLFEGSIKSNILFTEKYDEERYHQVIQVCALERDIELLPSGDQTIVGERGVSLSGGQKARINLARAIYRKADIYLLDDPLSAVDTHVGKHIFENCIQDFLKTKICVLVTHQLQYLKDIEHVVLMNLGYIDTTGSFRSLKRLNSYCLLSGNYEFDEKDSKYDEDGDVSKSIQKINRTISTPDDDDEIIIEKSKEFQITGAIGLKVFKTYFKSVGNNWILLWVFSLFIITQMAVGGVDILVTQWVNQEDTFTLLSLKLQNENLTANATVYADYEQKTEEYRQNHIIIYSLMVFMLFVLTLLRSYNYFKMSLQISRNLHDRLFRSITNATMHFFNQNPSGRILNRFAQDIGLIDSKLAIALVECGIYFLEFTATIVLVSFANYWLLLPTCVLSALFYGLRYIYVRTARNIKRVEALTRSPIYSHASATLQGLSTIRALKAQNELISEFDYHQNLNTSACFMFQGTTRAFAFWLELVCVLYVATITLSFLIFENETSSGNVGLAITQVFNLVFMSQWGMRQTAELENQMISVERIIEYTDIPPETSDTEQSNEKEIEENATNINDYLTDDWPKKGSIEFRNLSLKYAEDDAYILKDLNFTIKPNEKIGIVGRTGAGKSSIIQAMFRLACNEGIIQIDNVNIDKISLNRLRNRISIIPQDPMLFTGTLRSNLDPNEIKTDDEIWNVLEKVELKTAIKKLPDGIYSNLLDGGSNFSMGQRQLVCLARAILRNNRILILDEATASVDPETDKLIQNTIKTKFKECTVLTIAHRLHTVMDCDRVLVMDAGRVVEFDHPHNLLQKFEGKFKMFVEQTGSAMTERLKQIAEKNYNKQTETTRL